MTSPRELPEWDSFADYVDWRRGGGPATPFIPVEEEHQELGGPPTARERRDPRKSRASIWSAWALACAVFVFSSPIGGLIWIVWSAPLLALGLGLGSWLARRTLSPGIAAAAPWMTLLTWLVPFLGVSYGGFVYGLWQGERTSNDARVFAVGSVVAGTLVLAAAFAYMK